MQPLASSLRLLKPLVYFARKPVIGSAAMANCVNTEKYPYLIRCLVEAIFMDKPDEVELVKYVKFGVRLLFSFLVNSPGALLFGIPTALEKMIRQVEIDFCHNEIFSLHDELDSKFAAEIDSTCLQQFFTDSALLEQMDFTSLKQLHLHFSRAVAALSQHEAAIIRGMDAGNQYDELVLIELSPEITLVAIAGGIFLRQAGTLTQLLSCGEYLNTLDVEQFLPLLDKLPPGSLTGLDLSGFNVSRGHLAVSEEIQNQISISQFFSAFKREYLVSQEQHYSNFQDCELIRKMTLKQEIAELTSMRVVYSTPETQLEYVSHDAASSCLILKLSQAINLNKFNTAYSGNCSDEGSNYPAIQTSLLQKTTLIRNGDHKIVHPYVLSVAAPVTNLTTHVLLSVGNLKRIDRVVLTACGMDTVFPSHSDSDDEEMESESKSTETALDGGAEMFAELIVQLRDLDGEVFFEDVTGTRDFWDDVNTELLSNGQAGITSAHELKNHDLVVAELNFQPEQGLTDASKGLSSTLHFSLALAARLNDMQHGDAAQAREASSLFLRKIS